MAMLEVKDLTMYYKTLRGYVKAVDSVSFELEKGKALGLAGESGCGKSSMATTVLRLLPSNGNIMGGSVKMDGKELVSLTEEDFRKEVRWKRMSMVFQGAMNALNPVHRIGDQITEAILAHENVSKQEAKDRMLTLLDMVGINPKRYNEYPHEFSGGMKQRVVIAMALACNPDIIIADEPTTALDVMVQAQVLTAMEGLRKKMGLGMILITHDLAVIAQTCDDVAIMYGGKIVEYGSAKDIYLKPRHPYTMGLVKAFPNIAAEKQKVRSIPGSPPNLLSPPEGCRFNPRCPMATDRCRMEEPPLAKSVKGEQKVACHRESEIEEGVDIWQ
ncbi:MAG TPA: ABC transporter ATP-binding protein [Bacillota bacterium]|nr:MAG: Oligopeptide transport ATP-binding protein OppD [Firmicutes bacterium ADurb.Bin153]HNV34534.1 ABC transporter ATP-binding protein [Bacillota bacterium]